MNFVVDISTACFTPKKNTCTPHSMDESVRSCTSSIIHIPLHGVTHILCTSLYSLGSPVFWKLIYNRFFPIVDPESPARVSVVGDRVSWYSPSVLNGIITRYEVLRKLVKVVSVRGQQVRV